MNSNIPHQYQDHFGFKIHGRSDNPIGVPDSIFFVAIPNGVFGDCIRDAYELDTPFLGYWVDPATDVVYCERSYAIADSRLAYEIATAGEQISVLCVSGASKTCYILNVSDWIIPEYGFIYAGTKGERIGTWSRVDSTDGLQGYTKIDNAIYTAV